MLAVIRKPVNPIEELKPLLQKRNQIDNQIAKLIDKPALQGHIGEFIASKIFDIKLHDSATHSGSDGIFNSGPLKGKEVNVKWYGKREGILDIRPEYIPDYYLVFTGPKISPQSSKGTSRPLIIESVFLFEATSVIERLKQRDIKIGVATSVISKEWLNAEIYPDPTNMPLPLTNIQKEMIALFQ